MPMLRFLPGPTAGTRRNLQQRRSHAGAPRVCSCCCLRHGTGRPWHYHGTQGALTASQARRADSLTAVAVPGRSAAMDVCVASSIAAAARGDAAQTAFDRKLSHYRNEIGEMRHRGIHYRPLVWTGRIQPSRERFSTRQTSPPPKRAASVGEIPSSHVETRDPNRSPAPEGSHGPRSSPESFSAGKVASRRHHRQSFEPLGTCPPLLTAGSATSNT